LIEITKSYKPKDIYNCDETGIFWRLLPNKTVAFNDESGKGGKKAKDRVTALLFSNSDGTDRDIILIGKSKSPRCFKEKGKRKKLPLKYYNQHNAWINANIFEDVLKNFNKKIKREKRNVVLFMDNCSCHLMDKVYSNVKIVYFPPLTTSALQPLDQGIISSFKAFYRKIMISFMISQFENGDDVTEKDITLYNAMDFMDNAWKSVTDKTIINCFTKAGFQIKTTIIEKVSENDSDEDSDDNFWEKLKIFTPISYETFEEYVNFDSHLDCYQELSDQEIVNAVLESKEEIEEVKVEELNETDFMQVPSSSEAFKSLFVLQNYFRSFECESALEYLSCLQKLLSDNQFKALKQTKITNHFFASNDIQ
jgi:hypothetical protein